MLLNEMREALNLKEARQRGLLYRNMNLRGMIEILERDSCSTKYYGSISFTRDRNMVNYVGKAPRSIFQLIVDGDSLSNNYKIQPYADRIGTSDQRRSEEREERVRASTINHISRYIVGVNIIINSNDFWFRGEWELNDDDTFTSPYTVADARGVIVDCDHKFGIKNVIVDGKNVGIDWLKEHNLY